MEPIKTISSLYLIEELSTDGHSPMKFLCEDGNVYYCKYLPTFRSTEIDFLVYEIVCHYLLKHLNIPTPEIALVALREGSFSSKALKRNKRNAKSGVICFGSKEINESQLVTELDVNHETRTLKSLLNPADLIRIALFDLWTDNTDRGKNKNYNLLKAASGNKYYLVAFDHAFAFGGEAALGIINPELPFVTSDKLLNSSYYRSIISLIPSGEQIEIINNFVSLLHDENIEQILLHSYAQIPETWKVSLRLFERITSFLRNSNRISRVKEIILLSITN